MVMWRSLITHRILAFVNETRYLACLTNGRSLTSTTQKMPFTSTVRHNQSEAPIPGASTKPELPKFEKGSKNYDSKKPKEDTRLLNLLGIFVGGMITYYGISTYLEYKKRKPRIFEIDYTSQNLPGLIRPSKSVGRERNPGNVKLTLYQFTTCPFCCKVRAYLDYFGYSYDIVEVNSLTKKQLNWSLGYKV